MLPLYVDNLSCVNSSWVRILIPRGPTIIGCLFFFMFPFLTSQTNRDSPKLHKCYLFYVCKQLCSKVPKIIIILSDQSIPLVTITSLFYVLRIPVCSQNHVGPGLDMVVLGPNPIIDSKNIADTALLSLSTLVCIFATHFLRVHCS